ncbi:MAG: Two-component system sensor histidine kinase [Rhodanobacteraceae bacterium]|jgi:two-component system sensor histidine kinase DesK|nr:MAG: Two-component system sensor histidine kinase [Rhodanobacteraceae bacterium]
MIRPEIDTLFTKIAPDSVIATGRWRGGPRVMRFMPLVSLVWLGWIFGPAIFNVGSPFQHWLWPTLASLPVFLFLYWRGYTCSRRNNLWYAIAIAALGMLVTPLNPFAETYLIYACAIAAFCHSLRFSIGLMLAMLALYSLEWLLIGFPWPYLANAVLIGLIVGIMGMYQNVVQLRQAELRLSHDEVRRLAASAERERIGRDLHDLLGHTLSMVTLKSELAGRLIERDPDAARREIADVERVAREALSQVRSAVSGIRAAALVSELASARLLLETAGVQMEYWSDGKELPSGVETCLALALREAVTNIQRHARANRVEVTVIAGAERVVMRIRDDGRGGVNERGNGLTGMRERIAGCGGEIWIESPRGKGTAIEIRLPLPVERGTQKVVPIAAASLAQHAGGRA